MKNNGSASDKQVINTKPVIGSDFGQMNCRAILVINTTVLLAAAGTFLHGLLSCRSAKNSAQVPSCGTPVTFYSAAFVSACQRTLV